VKKIIMPAIAALAILAVVSMPAYAGPGCGKGDKPACSAIGFKAACGDADKGVCMTKYGMTEEDCKEVCTTLAGNCDFAEISIKGMTCNGCETILTTALEKVPGVAKVVMISYKDGKAVVAVDRKKAKDDFLVKAVADNGYKAEIIPAVATTVETKPAAQSVEKSKVSCDATTKAACAATGKSCPSVAKKKGDSK
jgi:copper chaperone CopZ